MISTLHERYRYWRWRIFGITWLAYASYYFTRKAFSVAKVGLDEDPSVHLTKEMMANIDVCYLITYALGAFLFGILVERFGPRLVVLSGLMLSVFVSLLMGMFAIPAVFMIFMGIQGLAQSTGWCSLCKNLSEFFSVNERGRVLGLWCSCYAVGGLLASPFAAWWAYEVFHNWRAAFIAPAIYLLFVWILFFLLQRNTPADVGLPVIEEYHQDESQIAPTEEAEFDNDTKNYRDIVSQILANRMILVLGLAYFLLKPARYAILLWGPYIVYKELPAISKLSATVIPVAFEAAGFIAPFLIGLASDLLFEARRIPVCVISLFALTVMLLLFMPLLSTGNITLVVLIFFGIGITLYGPDALISSTAGIDFGSHQGAGAATGFINGCGSVGAIFGGLLPGYLETTTIFYGFAAINCLAAIILLPHWRSTPAIMTKVSS